MNNKDTVILPQNPNHYYGSSISVGNLYIGDIIFYLPHNKSAISHIQKFKIEAFAASSKKDFYEIHTNQTVFLASQNTRVNMSKFI